MGPFPNTTLSLAFNFFGDNNTVSAGWGPFAIAGAIAQNLRTITRSIPGININGINRQRGGSGRQQQEGLGRGRLPRQHYRHNDDIGRQ